MTEAEELKTIMEKFAGSGWNLITGPAQAWLETGKPNAALVAAIRQADTECGSCGCEFDPLYKRALQLLGGGDGRQRALPPAPPPKGTTGPLRNPELS